MSKETITALLWLLPAVLLSTTGELFLKRGMNQVGVLDFAGPNFMPTVVRMALNVNIWLGFIGFMGGSVFWLSVISRVPLSFAYPMLGLNYVIIAVESWIFLGEGLNTMTVAGALVVGAGVAMVGLSGAAK
ncbi:MAG: EamA family transporter [Chloroflexi bacterium]|nr:EamA family transporter [Chloroflexota bacterium]